MVKVNQNVKFTKINFDLKRFYLKLKIAELETIVGGGLRSTSAMPLVCYYFNNIKSYSTSAPITATTIDINANDDDDDDDDDDDNDDDDNNNNNSNNKNNNSNDNNDDDDDDDDDDDMMIIIITRGAALIERKPPPTIDYGLCIISKHILASFL